MTMIKRYKKSLWEKIYHFFLKFKMCKCKEPKYEVLKGILTCHFCKRPAAWKN